MKSLILDALLDILVRRERSQKLRFISRTIFIAVSFAAVGYGVYTFLGHYTAIHSSIKLLLAYLFTVGELLILIWFVNRWFKLKKPLIPLKYIVSSLLKTVLNNSNRKFTVFFIILAIVVLIFPRLKRV